MPHLPQLKFKFDPQNVPSGVAILWTLHFRSMRSYSMTQLVFHLFGENMIFRKDLESPLIFVLFFKEKQNKKEKP